MIFSNETLYKFDTKGKLRVWRMDQEGSRHRTVAGIAEGNLVTSEWTQCHATNVGRSNERNPTAQAKFEIEAEYEKKLAREYHRTPQAAKGGAHYFKPMLAQKYEEFERGFAQPKLDGIRCIAKADGLWSRQGKQFLNAPHIEEELAPLFAENPEAVLDGELYNHDLKDDFNSISSAVKNGKPNDEEKALARKVQYHVYDHPSAKGVFGARHEHLTKLHHKHKLPGDVICLVETVAVEDSEAYDDQHGQWLEAGYEGSILRLNGTYEQKRSNNLLKRKEFQDEEFEVVRIEAGTGNWAGVAKRVICKLPDGREFGAGIKGSKTRAAELLHEKHKIVTIKFFTLTPAGIPRFGVATKFHGNKREL